MTLRAGRATLPGDLELPYVEQGDDVGVPVVLLHAYADSWRSFERVLASLPPSIHALAVTQRGHGDATKAPEGYEIEDFTSDLERFLDVMELDPAILVASSSAGFTVRRLAAESPEHVAGIVLIGTPWSLRERAPSLEFVDAVFALEDPVDPSFVREFVVGTSSERVPRDVLELMIEESLKVPAHVWKQTLAGLLVASPDGTGSISAPTLLLWGDRDELAPRNDQERLLAAIQGSRLVVYESVGHAVHWEQPERVAADVAAFAVEVAG